MILTRIKKVRQMGSIHPTDFIIYDFNKKRLQFEGLFQRPLELAPYMLFVKPFRCKEFPYAVEVGIATSTRCSFCLEAMIAGGKSVKL